MKMHTSPAARQRGFSILTGFILAIIMFGSLAFFLAGQGINAGFGSKYTNQAKVAGLLASAGYINTGFDAITLGGESASNVTFDAAVGTGVFNPAAGGATLQAIDPELLARKTNGVDGVWVYRKSAVKMKGVGDSVTNNADFTMMVSGLKQAICQQINYTLHGTDLATTPAALGSADGAVIGATPATITVLDGVGVSTAADLDLSLVGVLSSGWMSGCYQTTTAVGTDKNYVYIHTLLAQ